MKQYFVSPVLALAFVISMAGCVFYFKEQFALYAVKFETFSGIKIEKEQVFRLPRAKPLRVFRPPPISPGLAEFGKAALKFVDKTRSKTDTVATESIPESLADAYKKTAHLEYLIRNYIKDSSLLIEVDAFQHVSNTLAARLLIYHHTASVYKKRSPNLERLKDVLKTVLIENSDVIYFEMMLTFEDTLSAFPDVAVNLIQLIEFLDVSDEQKVQYLSRYLGRSISTIASAQDLEREKSTRLSILKLREFGISENEIKILAESQAQQNKKSAARFDELEAPILDGSD